MLLGLLTAGRMARRVNRVGQIVSIGCCRGHFFLAVKAMRAKQECEHGDERQQRQGETRMHEWLHGSLRQSSNARLAERGPESTRSNCSRVARPKAETTPDPCPQSHCTTTQPRRRVRLSFGRNRPQMMIVVAAG